MKWRDVDKIPYGTPKGRMPKDKKYRTAVTLQRVNGIEYMVIDFFEKKNIFLRAAYRKTDYGLYWPEQKERSGQRLTDQFAKIKATREPVLGECLNGHIWMRKEDEEKIFLFCTGKGTKEQPWKTWRSVIENLENSVVQMRHRRREEKAEERMRQRHADTPEVPETFLDYAAGLVSGVGYLFYRKKNGYGTVRCSRCGSEYKIRYKMPEGIDALYGPANEEPVDNHSGSCEFCGGHGIYKPIGRMKNRYDVQQACYLIQPFREKGIVLREFVSEKILSTDSPEEVCVGERSRAYFLDGREQTDWYVFSVCGDGWSYTNGGGMNPWKMLKGPVWQRSWELIRNTEFGHSGCREWLMHLSEHLEQESPVIYFRAYSANQRLEMAVKAGLWVMVKECVSYGAANRIGTFIQSPEASKPADILGIWPERMKMLKEKEGNLRVLGILQEERNAGIHLPGDMLTALWEINGGAGIISHILRYMGIRRFLNRVEKYSGAEFGTGCGTAETILHHTARTYLDYLDMQAETGADMTDQIIQHPRDLAAEHDKLVLARNEKENEKKCREKDNAFPLIGKQYRKLSRRFRYESDGLLIRPAKSAGEIIREGQTLHHCVGGDSYLGKHNNGRSYILFLRQANMETVPYITVEIDPKTDSILQWYGVRDTKPDRTAVQRWLDEYINLLKQYGSMEAARAAAETTVPEREEIRLMAAV